MKEWKITLVGDTDGKEESVELELDEEFVEWFKKTNNISRWSDKKFRLWFSSVLRTTLTKISTEDSMGRNKYSIIYDRKKRLGSLDDIQEGDLVGWFAKNGGQQNRLIEKVLKSGVKTAPLFPGDKPQTIKFIEIIDIQRKN